MPRRQKNETPKPLPQLTVARSEARERIAHRIAKGIEIRNIPIRTQTELDAAGAERDKWGSYNTELLNRIFDTPAIAEEYNSKGSMLIPGNVRLDWWINDFREGVTQKINRLEAIAGRLDLIPAPGDNSARISNVSLPSAHDEVFLVHGHDEAAKETVARFIEKLDLKPVILHEQPSPGRTIIEKFEAHADVAFGRSLNTGRYRSIQDTP